MESALMDEELKDSPKVNGKSHHLEALMIGKNRYSHAGKTLYRIYDTPDHYELVEAQTAAEAFEKAGSDKVHKIVREHFSGYVSISKELVEKSDESIEVDVNLPEQDIKQLFLESSVIDDALEKAKRHFEEVDPGRWHNKAEAPAKSEESEAAATTASEPETIPEPEEEKPLSTDEVNALLGAQEE